MLLLVLYVPCDSSSMSTQAYVLNLNGWFVVSSNKLFLLYLINYFLIFYYYII